VLQAPPTALISAVMVRLESQLSLASPAGYSRVLPFGISSMAVVLHVIVAAMVILAVILATTRQSFPWQMRSAAVSVLAAARGNMANAMQMLRDMASTRHWPWPRNPSQFILNAKRSFEERGSVLPFKHGRRSRMPEAAEIEIINLVHGGYEHMQYISGQPVHVKSYYRSFTEACSTNGRIAQLMTQYGFRSASALKRHLDAKHPGALHLHSADIKQVHTPQQRAQRVTLCDLALQHLNAQPNLIKRVCYMDGFHVKVKPATRFAYYCSPEDTLGVNLVIEMPAHLLRGEIKIHMFAVVNPFLGPVYMEYVSGTQADVPHVHPNYPHPTYYVSAGSGMQPAACSQLLPSLSIVTRAPSRPAMYCGYGISHTMPCPVTAPTRACM
jgi:hypothetical protein